MEIEPDAARATALLRRLITRPPSERELEVVLQFYHEQLKRLETGELDAAKIAEDKDATAEFAAWVMTARAVMNLDEVITKQ